VAGGIAGLVAASEAASAAIAGTFAAIVPGTLLLAFAYWGVLNAAPTHWRPLNMPSTSGLHARTSSGTATPAAIVKKARPFPQEKGHGSTLFEPASGLHRTPRSPTSAPPHEVSPTAAPARTDAHPGAGPASPPHIDNHLSRLIREERH
jgi:hypothetical protein